MKKLEFETFTEIGQYEIGNLTQKQPSSINGWVRIRKYKVTIEEVEEPKSVLEERIQTLWDNCNNHHHWTPIAKEAVRIGYKLKGNAGNKLKNH